MAARHPQLARGRRALRLRQSLWASALVSDAFTSPAASVFSGFFEAAGATVFGFLVLAVVTSAVGYLIASWWWQRVVRIKRARRLRKMEDRLDQRLGADKG